jgi:hypothetical protein
MLSRYKSERDSSLPQSKSQRKAQAQPHQAQHHQAKNARRPTQQLRHFAQTEKNPQLHPFAQAEKNTIQCQTLPNPRRHRKNQEPPLQHQNIHLKELWRRIQPLHPHWQIQETQAQCPIPRNQQHHQEYPEITVEEQYASCLALAQAHALRRDVGARAVLSEAQVAAERAELHHIPQQIPHPSHPQNA